MSEPSKKRGLPLRVKMRHEAHFVEELTARHEVPVGKMVPLSMLEPDPEQPRGSMGDLSDLVASIREKGILEPLLVRPWRMDEERADDDAGQSPSAYRIISGERRYRAAVEAGLFEVPVIAMDLEDQEVREIALIENLQRKDLTPFEEAEGYRALAETHDYTHEDIATAVGKSRTVITESLSLLAIPVRVRSSAEALGIGSKSLLLEVVKAGSEGEMLELLERVAAEGLSRDDLRKETRNGGKQRSAASSAGRRKPYRFKFRAPDKSFTLNLSFRKSTVERDDLIGALEEILVQLRSEQSQEE
ncbi:MAG TPA: ParB/RepB/Spo0J family partition protein [Thermoanaerobaculia bacterium]|nr:ParB/RepB/Spo0J family partition protein [Thermoanaerobaculia bacterium]